jgi:hypothetical protein
MPEFLKKLSRWVLKDELAASLPANTPEVRAPLPAPEPPAEKKLKPLRIHRPTYAEEQMEWEMKRNRLAREAAERQKLGVR